jgi:hypothetical protein
MQVPAVLAPDVHDVLGMFLLEVVQVFLGQDLVTEADLFGSEEFVGGNGDLPFVYLLQLLDLLHGLLLVGPKVFFHGLFRLQLLRPDFTVSFLFIPHLHRKSVLLLVRPLLELLLQFLQLPTHPLLHIGDLILVFAVLALILLDSTPLNAHDLQIGLIFSAPLQAGDVALLVET